MKIKEEQERNDTGVEASEELSAEATERLRQAASVLLLQPWCLCKLHVTHGGSLQGRTHSSQSTFTRTNLTVKLQRGACSGHITRLGSQLPDVDSNKRKKRAYLF